MVRSFTNSRIVFSAYCPLTRFIPCLFHRFPETWQVGGVDVFYTPNLGAIPDGFYKSGDPVVVKEHVKALDYGLMDLGIISCEFCFGAIQACGRTAFRCVSLFFRCVCVGWGESDRLDRARITQLMEESARQGSPIKWTVYYEDEEANDFSVDAIVKDLNYLKKWFA